MSKDMNLGTGAVPPYLSGHNRARWTMLLLGAAIVLDLIAVPSDLLQYDLLDRISRGDEFTIAEAEANDTRQSLIGIVQVLILVATVVVYLMWLHRAHRNLPALGAQNLRFTPGWAVGWWFVPFANLVRPYQVVKEVWQASCPDVGASDWSAFKASPVIISWWLLFLVSGVLGQQAARFAFKEDPAELMAGSAFLAASDGLDAIAAALAIVIVLKIDRWQWEKAGAQFTPAS